MRLHQLHRFLSGIPPVSEARHFLSCSLRRRSLRTHSTCICICYVAYWERDVRILSPSIQTCSMGTRCRNPEYEVDGRTTGIIIIAIIHIYIYTEKFAVHNASVGLAQARPNYRDDDDRYVRPPRTQGSYISFPGYKSGYSDSGFLRLVPSMLQYINS